MKLVNNLYCYPERGMMDANVYVLKGNPGIIFDTGMASSVPARAADMKKDGIDPGDIGIIVNTHLHIDHSIGNESFKALSGAKIALHPAQKENYQLIVIDGTRLLGTEPIEFKEDFLIEKDRLKVDNLEIECIPCPGHSPDSICYYLRKEKVLICGDVLFEMNTGRVDLPGGSADELRQSIDSLSKLDIELLLPGHMNPVAGVDNVKRNFQYIQQNIFPWL
jgi:glyoxylase-like metal-dependent hydrolase (beta-lactamase superfamily II)